METSLLFQQFLYHGRLETFKTDLTNHLDNKVDDILTELKNQYNIGMESFNKYKAKIEVGGDLTPKNFVSNLALENNIVALLETKIIYLWKIFEVRLKELIRLAYNVENKDFYKFDSLIDFLKEQGITFDNTNKDYNIIRDLLKVNNQCKHEGLKWCDKISHIQEFSKYKGSRGYIPFEQIEKFYNRVKSVPESFLVEVKRLIFEDRFSFNKEKYKDVAKPLVKRMNHQQAIEFMEVFLDIYNLKPEHLTNTKNDINGIYLESI